MFRIFFIVLQCSCSTKYQSHLPRLLRLYQITRSNKNPYWRLENPCNVFLCWQKLFNFTLDFYKSRTCVIIPDPSTVPVENTIICRRHFSSKCRWHSVLRIFSILFKECTIIKTGYVQYLKGRKTKINFRTD